MEIQKSISVKFSDEDEMLINKMLYFISEEFGKSEICQALGCDYCPFRGLCDFRNADQIEKSVNNYLCD